MYYTEQTIEDMADELIEFISCANADDGYNDARELAKEEVGNMSVEEVIKTYKYYINKKEK